MPAQHEIKKNHNDLFVINNLTLINILPVLTCRDLETLENEAGLLK